MSQVVGASVDVGSNSRPSARRRVDDHQLDAARRRIGVPRPRRRGRERRAARRGGAARSSSTPCRDYAAIARGLGASSVTLVGTEPIRRAADAARIVARGRGARRGVAAPRPDPRGGGLLTLLGVTGGRLVDPRPSSSTSAAAAPSSASSARPTARGRPACARLGRLTARRRATIRRRRGEVEAMRRGRRRPSRRAPDASPQRDRGRRRHRVEPPQGRCRYGDRPAS